MMKPPSILILGEHTDKSTDLVCQWLHYWRKPFLRLNAIDVPNPKVEIRFEDADMHATLYKKGIPYTLCAIRKTWFRRGYMEFRSYGDLPEVDPEINDFTRRHLKNEGDTLEDFLYYAISQGVSINNPKSYNYNKLIALHEAQKVGFAIPSTIVSTSSNSLKNFLTENRNCISKSIQDMMGIQTAHYYIFSGKTIRVKENDISSKGQWYTLFQKEIKKKYELRIFFFVDKIYTMAIFSQMDKKSEVDFRQVDVNGNRPNRMVPFNLPVVIAQKLKRLMKNLRLESGSIDILVDENNDYYFLEVNPVGQFNFVSEICNYHIEKYIAKFLSE